MKQKAVIEDFSNTFSIYNEAGQMIEADFDSYEDAETWANENDYEVVRLFNASPSTPVDEVKDKQMEPDVIPEVLAEVREYTNLPIMLTDFEFAPNHLFCVRGKYCEFTELSKVVQVYVYPTYQKDKHTMLISQAPAMREALISCYRCLTMDSDMEEDFAPEIKEIVTILDKIGW